MLLRAHYFVWMKDTQTTSVSLLRFLGKRRLSSTPLTLASTRWPWFLFPGATLALLSFLVLDGPVATSRDAMSGGFRNIAARLTDITTAPWIVIASGLVAVLGFLMAGRARWRPALVTGFMASYVFFSVALASASINIVKRLIGRARPDLFAQVGDFHFQFANFGYDYASFPSGHSTTAGAVFMALGLLFPRFRLAFVCLAIFFGLARVAVGAHYPSDVAAGLFYGAWVSVATACIFARYRLLFEVTGAGLPGPRARSGSFLI